MEFPIVVVDKKDGSKRFCVDFRQLNKLTKFNYYPLPLIDDILALLGGSKYFTTLDLKSGYLQVLVQEKDKEKTAYTCHRGLFWVQCYAFWFANSTSSFSGTNGDSPWRIRKLFYCIFRRCSNTLRDFGIALRTYSKCFW